MLGLGMVPWFTAKPSTMLGSRSVLLNSNSSQLDGTSNPESYSSNDLVSPSWEEAKMWTVAADVTSVCLWSPVPEVQPVQGEFAC